MWRRWRYRRGGIGGTGIGTITGFGRVIINNMRTFDITAEIGLYIDGDAVSEPEPEQAGVGLVTRVIVSDDVSDDFMIGTALTVEAENPVKGPVTGVNPLQVLEQMVVVNGDTLLVDMAGDIGNQRGVLNGVVPRDCNGALARVLLVILLREITRRPGYAAGARWFHAAA